MAKMLGALPEDIADPEERALSHIELDAGALVLGKVAGVLRSAITVSGGFEPIVVRARQPSGPHRPTKRKRAIELRARHPPLGQTRAGHVGNPARHSAAAAC
ncbi:MAG: hypothetical protein QM775_25490 [Pirellulales bacterium]